MVKEHIQLYHGGQRSRVNNLYCGLNPQRDFYCTRDRYLAQNAANDHAEGALFSFNVPQDEFDRGISLGLFEERAYLGCIMDSESSEVIIKKGEGIRFANRFLPSLF